MDFIIARTVTTEVASRRHDFHDGQQAAYDALPWRGRTAYDRLRTILGYGHDAALEIASQPDVQGLL